MPSVLELSRVKKLDKFDRNLMKKIIEKEMKKQKKTEKKLKTSSEKNWIKKSNVQIENVNKSPKRKG